MKFICDPEQHPRVRVPDGREGSVVASWTPEGGGVLGNGSPVSLEVLFDDHTTEVFTSDALTIVDDAKQKHRQTQAQLLRDAFDPFAGLDMKKGGALNDV
jgi:hypothetical protein